MSKKAPKAEPSRAARVKLGQFTKGASFGFMFGVDVNTMQFALECCDGETDDYLRGMKVAFVARGRIVNAERKRLGLPAIRAGREEA